MRILILGAGPAGITAAEAVRRADPITSVTVVSTEPYPPYSPPAMAEYFATGRERPLFWKGTDVVERLGITYRTGAHAVGIDPGAHLVGFADGSELPYDRLLVATGARLYAPVGRAELDGIGDFKSLSSAEAMIARVRGGTVRSAIVVGNGFIGMEIALLLADLGVRTTIVGRRTWLMPRMLDPETGEIVARAMTARGVELLLGVEATEFLGTERAEGIRLADGGELRADLCVAATGVKPNTELLAGSGIATEWGVRVDRHLRTSVADVWAAGDVVEAPDRQTGEPYVHAIFPNAVEQGRIAAANLLGGSVAYAGAESMNSLKHLGLPLLAVGSADGGTEMRYRRGEILRKAFVADGRLVGFRLTGDVSGGGFLHSLLLRGSDVTPLGTALVAPGSRLGITMPAAAFGRPNGS